MTELPRRALAAGVLLALAYALVFSAIWLSHRDSCAARAATLDVDRDLILAAQSANHLDKTRNAAQRVASDLFVAAALKRVDEARC